jgi:hypothetical protein
MARTCTTVGTSSSQYQPCFVTIKITQRAMPRHLMRLSYNMLLLCYITLLLQGHLLVTGRRSATSGYLLLLDPAEQTAGQPCK